MGPEDLRGRSPGRESSLRGDHRGVGGAPDRPAGPAPTRALSRRALAREPARARALASALAPALALFLALGSTLVACGGDRVEEVLTEEPSETALAADTMQARAVDGGEPARFEPGRLGRALTRAPGILPGRPADGRVLSYLEARGQPPAVLETVRGEATFYADYFHLRRTASGEIFDQRQMVAAHRRYPFGTILRVTNTENDSSVVVRVVDRGPFAPGRRMPAVLDLSRAAAERLDFIRQGRAIVRLEVLEWGGD